LEREFKTTHGTVASKMRDHDAVLSLNRCLLKEPVYPSVVIR
jgi:hypothetical protein